MVLVVFVSLQYICPRRMQYSIITDSATTQPFSTSPMAGQEAQRFTRLTYKPLGDLDGFFI